MSVESGKDSVPGSIPSPLWRLLGLGGLALGMNLVAVAVVGGIRLGGESWPCLEAAKGMLEGTYHWEVGATSLGYDVVVAASLRLGWGLAGVIGLQVALGAIAVAAQYDVGRRLAGPLGGLIAAVLLLLNPDVTRWHAYLLPDSLYISTVVVGTWAIQRATESPGVGRLAAAAGLILAGATLRPNGWLLVPVLLGFTVFPRWVATIDALRRTRRARWVSLAVMLAMLAVLAPPLRAALRVERPGVESAADHIILGYADSRVKLPGEDQRGGFVGLGQVARPSWDDLRLAALRVGTELAHIRPFYSMRHNLAVLVSLPLLYVLALLGFIRTRRKSLAQLLAVVIGVHLLLAALTHADWDGRPLLYALPPLSVLAARGIVSIRVRVRTALALGLLVVVLGLAHRPLLVGFADRFRVHDPAPSDALVLLLGGERDRAETTAALYHQGLAPLIVMGADPDLELNREILLRHGVPATAILSLGPTLGTMEEAQRVSDYARAHSLRRVTVVTTAFHTARSRWLFSRALRGSGVAIHTVATRHPRFDESNWYTCEEGLQAYCSESIKTVYSWFAY